MPKRLPDPSEQMVITTVALTKAQHSQLRHLAVDAGKSLRDLIRDAVDEYLKRQGKRGA